MEVIVKRLFALSFVIILLGSFLLLTPLGSILRQGNVEALAVYMDSIGILAYITSIFIIIIQTFFPFIPFFILAGANSIVFGVWEGYFISFLSAVLGAIIAFLFSRYIAREYALKQSERYPLIKKINDQITINGFFIFFLARLIPIIPSSGINFYGGITTLSLNQFFWSTFLGNMPIVLLETFIGHDLVHFKQHPIRLTILVLIFITLIFLGYFINKRLSNEENNKTRI